MSIDALELTRRLYVAGATLDLTDHGTIRLTGQPVPADVLDDLKAHKPAILDLMTAQGIGTNDDGFASIVPRRYVLPDTCLANNACARLGPCSHFLMRRSCGVSTRGEPA